MTGGQAGSVPCDVGDHDPAGECVICAVERAQAERRVRDRGEIAVLVASLLFFVAVVVLALVAGFQGKLLLGG